MPSPVPLPGLEPDFAHELVAGLVAVPLGCLADSA